MTHPLIQKLNDNFVDGEYGLAHYAIRFLSLNYELDDQGKLSPLRDYWVSSILTKAFAGQFFMIPENRRLINDFSQQTGFKSFYRSQRDFYQNLIQNYHQLGDLEDMWSWLETRYPNRIQSYRILCSPMTGGLQT